MVIYIHRQLIDMTLLVQGGEGTQKEASGCWRLGGEAARMPPKSVYKYRDNDGGVTVTPSGEWHTLNAATNGLLFPFCPPGRKALQ